MGYEISQVSETLTLPLQRKSSAGARARFTFLQTIGS